MSGNRGKGLVALAKKAGLLDNEEPDKLDEVMDEISLSPNYDLREGKQINYVTSDCEDATYSISYSPSSFPDSGSSDGEKMEIRRKRQYKQRLADTHLVGYESSLCSDSEDPKSPNSDEIPIAKQLWGIYTIKSGPACAAKAGETNKDLLTSTRLRKQIATVLQVMNIIEIEMEQFASFMGHSKKTHETYYRLPQDIFQTVKVSKLLLAINKGRSSAYKGKTLDQIEFSDNIDSEESESDSEIDLRKLNSRNSGRITHNNQSCDYNLTDTSQAGPSVLNQKNFLTKANDSMDSANSNSEEYDNTSTKFGRDNSMSKKQRVKYTASQKEVILKYFGQHIKRKQPPKKHEVEKLIQENKVLFKGKNWVKIKSFVYNCYRRT